MSQIITIDCDNVLADTAGSFIDWYTKTTGRVLTMKNLNQQYLRQCDALAWMCENAADPYITFWESILAGEYNIKPLAGAQEAVQSLSGQGYILKVVTGRGTMEHDETYRWIQYYFPGMFDEIVFGFECTDDFTDKGVLCSRLDASLHIDDYIQNGRDISVVGIPMILFDRLWNQSEEENDLIVRVDGWEDSLARIDENLSNKKTSNC